MNAAILMNEMRVSDMLVEELERRLSVVPEPTPEADRDRVGALHRRMVTKYSQRAADAKKALKATVSNIEAQRKMEKARHEMEMARLSLALVDAKEQAAADIEADRQLAASSQAALDVLQKAENAS